MIHQKDSKNKWLLLSASFTAKLWLVFVLTMENAFSIGFILSQQKKHRFILKTVQRILKIALSSRDQHVLCGNQWKL